WSPDSQSLAYLWRDKDVRPFLSIDRIDGSNRQTVPFIRPDGLKTFSLDDLAIQGWSIDHSYLSIAQKVDTDMLVAFWKTADLIQMHSALEGRKLQQSVWSSQGHLYAAVVSPVEPSGASELMLVLPGATPPVADIQMAKENLLGILIWSPDG